MLYQYVKRYLKNTSEKPNVNATWTALDNIKFFAHIEQRYTIAEFTKELSEVKEAFRDFFEPVGKIVFRYKEESGIKFKIFPYSVKPKDSKHLKNIIKIIHQNRKHIQYPYQHQNDQIAILGKIRRNINIEVSDSEESVNLKELVKYAIRKALELSDRDIITQLKRKYIVKIFEKNTVLESDVEAPSEREGAQNRFNGYTAEQIEETYKDIFEKGEVDVHEFLGSVMKHIFTKNLDFRFIKNHTYEEKGLKIIHTAIANELNNYISIEKDYILGLTGYLMRKYFLFLHQLMAIELLERIYEKDNNANEFLLYYNGSTILKNHKKYAMPSLETESGEKWNSASLIGICNLWMHTKRKKEQYEQKLIEVDKKIAEREKELEYIKPEKEFHEKILLKAETEFVLIDKEYRELRAKLNYLESTNLNSNEYFKIVGRFKKAETVYLDEKKVIREAKSNLRAIKEANMSTYTDLEYAVNQKKELLQDVKSQDLNLDAKNTQMDPILRSISKVLMERTKILKY